MTRSIIAVVAGFALWGGLWLTEGQLLMAWLPDAFDDRGATADVRALLALWSCASVNSILAGSVAAALCRDGYTPVVVLAGVLFAVGLLVQLSFWSLHPVWYHVGFLAVLIPCTLSGRALLVSWRSGRPRARES